MFTRNLARLAKPKGFQNFQRRSLSTDKPKFEERNNSATNSTAVVIGATLGSGLGAYGYGNETRSGERDGFKTVLGAGLGAVYGSLAGLFWRTSLICYAAIGAAYAIDNMSPSRKKSTVSIDR